MTSFHRVAGPSRPLRGSQRRVEPEANRRAIHDTIRQHNHTASGRQPKAMGADHQLLLSSEWRRRDSLRNRLHAQELCPGRPYLRLWDQWILAACSVGLPPLDQRWVVDQSQQLFGRGQQPGIGQDQPVVEPGPALERRIRAWHGAVWPGWRNSGSDLVSGWSGGPLASTWAAVVG